jgi:hypothetical protein
MSVLSKLRFAALALGLAAATGLCAQEAGTHVQDPVSSKALNTEAYVELLRADLSAKKEQIVRETMQLNEQQAEVFWPIYKEYQAEQTKLTAEKLRIVAEYARNFDSMTDDKADALAQRVMQSDEKRMALREKYYGIMKKALSAAVAVRFFQVEHQLQLIADLQIAANLPIKQQSDSN